MAPLSAELLELLRQSCIESVAASLREDIGTGDITAALIPADRRGKARVITRVPAIIAGQAWVDEVFRQIDPQVQVHWEIRDGDPATANQVLFTCEGPARRLLTAERAALNWLQTLSGVATRCRQFADQVA